jgi:inner membrane protein
VNLPLLGLLDGISPLWWLAAAGLLAGLEALTVKSQLIWPALAAGAVAAALWLDPDLSGMAQIGLFALLTIGFLCIGRAVHGRFGTEEAGRRRRRTAELIGQDAIVESFHWHEGQVNIGGAIWPARLDGRKSPEVGERVRVIAADGIVVWVRRLPRQVAAETPDADGE